MYRRVYNFTLATVKLLNLPRDTIRHADNEFCVQCMKLTTWYFISVYDKLIKSTQSVEAHTYTHTESYIIASNSNKCLFDEYGLVCFGYTVIHIV